MKFFNKISFYEHILILFIVWRITLFLAAIFAPFIFSASHPLFPYKDTILEPTNLPYWIWGFGNFDGVHYLRIALMGYKESQFSQAFFPIYPMLIKIFSPCCGVLITGLIISNTAFFIGLIALYKLFSMDFSRKVSFLSVVCLLCFPTSFYFGSVYSEGILFLFSVLTFYFLRKKQFIFAGLFAGLASATRLVGLFLLIPILYEVFIFLRNRENTDFKQLFQIILGPVLGIFGLVAYMGYLQFNFHNALLFLTSPFSFNTGRNGWFVLLPQIFYRYFKIFLSVPILSLAFFNAFLELSFTLFALFLLVYSFKKINFGYWLFALFGTLLPTLTGTLTSMPRYTLITFLLFPLLVKATGKYVYIFVSFLLILEVILSALFIRGYWVA